MGGTCRPINTFFRWGWLLVLIAGCATTAEEKQAKAEKKDFSVIRLFTEVRDPAAAGTRVELPRSSPAAVTIEPESFADERDVIRADVVNAVGGFAIRVQLTEHGRMTLEQASVTHAGRRLVVFGQWTAGEEDTVKRWLAAPVMRNAQRTGVIVFTPDCDRAEADRFVRGLNNVAIKLKNQEKPKKVRDAKPAETAAGKKETARERRKREAKEKEQQKSAAQEAMDAYQKSRQ